MLVDIVKCNCGTRAPTCLYTFNWFNLKEGGTIIENDNKVLACIECKNYDYAMKELLDNYAKEQEQEQKITVDNYDENGICRSKKTFIRKKETKPRQPKLNEDERDERFRQQDREKELRREQKIKDQNQIIKTQNKKIIKEKQQVVEDYKNKPIPTGLKVKQRDGRKTKCCKNIKCFPDEFEDVMRYFKLAVPFKYTNVCNHCFKRKLEKIQKSRDKMINKNTYDCPCGKSWFIPYEQKSKKWKNEIEKHKCSINHKLYEEDMDTFCDLKDYLGFNLYIKTKKELIEFIENRNINIKITVDDTKEIILKKLIDMFKTNKKFIIKQKEYDFWNDLSRDELCVLIKECGLKIKYYKNLTKDKLINQIIQYN